VSSNTGRKYIRFKMPIVVQHMLLTISAFGSMLSGYKIYSIQTVEIRDRLGRDTHYFWIFITDCHFMAFPLYHIHDIRS